MITAESIYESISIDAEWWLSTNPSVRIRGTLSGSNYSGFTLEIEGSFKVELGCEDDDSQYDNDVVILGESRRGAKYTLLHCYYTKANKHTNTLMQAPVYDTTYISQWFVEGAHFNGFGEIEFDSITFCISNFEEWHKTMPFKWSYENGDESCGVVYSKPDAVKIFDDENVTATIDYFHSTGTHTSIQDSVSIQKRAFIDIKVKEASLSFYDFEQKANLCFYSYMRKIVSFVEFAVQKKVFPYDIKASSVKKKHSETHFQDIKINYRTRAPEKFENLEYYKLLLFWSRIDSKPQEYFERWGELIDTIDMPIWLYLGSFEEFIYEDQRFMELAQAFEGYHRKKNPINESIIAEFDQKRKSILDTCPEECKEWFISNTEYSYEPSLGKRLREMLKGQDDLAKWFTKNSRLRSNLVQLIVDYRNGFAHCLVIDTEKFTPELRYRIAVFMQYFFAALILVEIGLSKEIVYEIITSNWTALQTPRLLQETLEEVRRTKK